MKALKRQLLERQLLAFIIANVSCVALANTGGVESLLPAHSLNPSLNVHIWASGSAVDSGTASIAFTYPDAVTEVTYGAGSCELQEQGIRVQCRPSEDGSLSYTVDSSFQSNGQFPSIFYDG